MTGRDLRQLHAKVYQLADDAVKLLGYVEKNVMNSEQSARQQEIELLEGDFHTYARQDRHRRLARPDFGGAS